MQEKHLSHSPNPSMSDQSVESDFSGGGASQYAVSGANLTGSVRWVGAEQVGDSSHGKVTGPLQLQETRKNNALDCAIFCCAAF